jgi:hypothetical protein
VDTSFKSLNQIVENISEQVKKINKGELDLPEIETLTSNAQELYERLVVIRYKAFEKIATKKPKTLTVEDEGIIPVLEEKEEEPFFDLTQEESNTTNEAETEMLFDFTEPVEEVKKAEIKVNQVKEKQVKVTIPKSINEKFENKNSINDAFKSATKKSLEDKLKFSPIDNLKSHININQKFLFISKLFNGDNDAYAHSIEKLNNFSNSDEAREYLNELSQQQNWDAEDENVITLVELVERRYV